jgi:predicted short-subunit dehydrogenase-like oxidoreductase (DUF2520 family)
MQKKAGQNIVIIGCGNLAWHLAKHFISLKKFDVLIYNHAPNKALAAFRKIGCVTHDNLDTVKKDAGFYFICVADQHLKTVSSRIKTDTGLVIHTSGSKSLQELKQHNAAVFYPLQTFSKNDEVDWKTIPLIIEARDASGLNQIKKIARLFSKKIIHLSSEERLRLHLSAVLVNNFTNALYVTADKLLAESRDKKINFQLLKPLIRQSVMKLDRLSPAEAQTGPAKRNDRTVMKQHADLLQGNKELQKLYKQLSHLIQTQQNPHA